MHPYAVFSIIEILAGAGLIAAAIDVSLRDRSVIPDVVRREWGYTSSLLFFCLAGYVFLALIISGNINYPVEDVAGSVFLAGACFIYIIVTLMKFSMQKVTEKEKDLGTITGLLREKTERLEREATVRKCYEQALSESDENFRSLVEESLSGVYIIQDGAFAYINPRFVAMFGYDGDELIGRDVLGMIHTEDRQAASEVLQDLYEKGRKGVHIQFRSFRKDKSVMHLDVVGSLTAFKGRPAVIGTIQDITGLRKTEDTLLLLERAAKTTKTGITITDTSGVIVYTNAAEAEMHGYAPEELIGKEVRILAPSSIGRRMTLEELRKSNTWMRESVNTRKDGSIFHAWLISDIVTDDSGEPVGVVTTCEDITDRKLAEEQMIERGRKLDHLAHHDALTGLPNRILFTDRLVQTINMAHRYGHQSALLVIDLDRFKGINDTLGHAVGDKLLQMVSARLTGCLRESDTAARIGGDEFTFILPEITHVEDAARLAQRTIDALAGTFHVEGRDLSISASIGVAIYPDNGLDVQSLICNADAAMYRAKELGRNNYQLFTAALNAAVSERIELEHRMKKALEKEEFMVYYQPVVDLATGGMAGVDALARWHDPVLGMVQPSRFLPVAQDTGLIVPLGERVLKAACRQNKQWQDRGYRPVPISVNISQKQLEQQDLVEMVAHALEESGLEARYLEIDIPEGAVLHDVEVASRTIVALDRLGVRISLDNFGSGQSSLRQIKKLPIHSLKIDRSFVQDMMDNPDDASISTAIVSLAHNLGLRVAAEGVEVKAQLDYLKALNCDMAQGYLFCEPLPAEKFARLMDDEKLFIGIAA